MDLSAYDFWRYIHVLLFVYWLGADLGVYYAAKYINRADLSSDERKRFMDLTLLLDMGPRTGLVLLFPVGFQLWSMSPLVGVSSATLWAVWISFSAWLVLVWVIHWVKSSPLHETLRKSDFAIRVAVITIMIGLGAYSLLTEEPFANAWLAWKVLLYGCVIATGLYLRKILKDFHTGFQMLDDATKVDEANRLIAKASPKGEWGAYLLWFLVALVAFLGVAKPL